MNEIKPVTTSAPSRKVLLVVTAMIVSVAVVVIVVLVVGYALATVGY